MDFHKCDHVFFLQELRRRVQQAFLKVLGKAWLAQWPDLQEALLTWPAALSKGSRGTCLHTSVHVLVEHKSNENVWWKETKMT